MAVFHLISVHLYPGTGIDSCYGHSWIAINLIAEHGEHVPVSVAWYSTHRTRTHHACMELVFQYTCTYPRAHCVHVKCVPRRYTCIRVYTCSTRVLNIAILQFLSTEYMYR